MCQEEEEEEKGANITTQRIQKLLRGYEKESGGGSKGKGWTCLREYLCHSQEGKFTVLFTVNI